ncbi:hypothetical protein, partial [Burkholderia thailandensis]|uniref:hypothetical protein n=1 Tax=Burkholderia thailandensis TaxID=57975 RepID=UPI0035C71FAA
RRGSVMPPSRGTRASGVGAESFFRGSSFPIVSSMCFAYVPAPQLALRASPPWHDSIATVSRRTVPRPDFGAVHP